MPSPARSFVSRAGDKLDFALAHFGLNVRGLICADLGSHVGGFVDCLLQRDARRVYSVDTAYGILAWKLRRDPRVVVLERTNAMHVTLPEPVDLVTIDVGWTTQSKILPAAARLLKPTGHVVTLIKPHYEAPGRLTEGVISDEAFDTVVASALAEISRGWRILAVVESPIRGHGGNRETLVRLQRLT